MSGGKRGSERNGRKELSFSLLCVVGTLGAKYPLSHTLEREREREREREKERERERESEQKIGIQWV